MEAYTEGKKKVCKPFKIDYSLDDADLGALNTLDEFNGWYIRDKFSKDTSDIINRELSDLLERGGTKREFAQTLETALEDHVTDSKTYWELLADHTLTKIQNMGHVSGYETAGVQYVKIVAVIDNKTTPICRAMNGKVFKVADFRKQYDKIIHAAEKHDLKAYKAAQPMVNGKAMKGEISEEDIKKLGIKLPPYHFRCRTTHVAYFSDPNGIVPKLEIEDQGGRSSHPENFVSEGNEVEINIQNTMKRYMDKYGDETQFGYKAFHVGGLTSSTALAETDSRGTYRMAEESASIFNRAILKIQNGRMLTFEEEYAGQNLDHEIWHNKAPSKMPWDLFSDAQKNGHETLTEFISRRTCNIFWDRLGYTKMQHQQEIIDNPKGGYSRFVIPFTEMMREYNLDTPESLKELIKIHTKKPAENAYKNLTIWMCEKTKVKGETSEQKRIREERIKTRLRHEVFNK